SAWPSRSSTTSSTSRAAPKRSASPRARTRRATSRPTPSCSGSIARARSPRNAWRARTAHSARQASIARTWRALPTGWSSAATDVAKKARLDVLLVERDLAASRERARALILAGKVEVDGRVIAKAGTEVAADAQVLLVADDHPYVSRGGVKLA